MAGSGGDSFVDPTANPIFIFDDAIYFTEALLLSPTENEDHLDAQLVMAAQLSDIEQPYKILALDPKPKRPTKSAPEASLETEMLAATSALSLQSEHRSSASIRSHETQSTGYTSQPSRRTSHDHATSEPSHSNRKSPSLFRASLSLDRTSYLAEPLLRANLLPRKSTSSASDAHSVMSSSSSMRERTSRRSKRATALFSKFKRTSSVIASKHSREPRSGEEVDMVILGTRKNHTFPSSDMESLRDSGYSEDGESSLDLPRGFDIKVSIAEHAVETFLNSPECDDSPSYLKEIAKEEKPISIDPMKCAEFRSLRKEQREQYQRIASFEANQWKALAVHQHCILKGIEAQFETDRHNKKQQHPAELERLEEFQLNLEHELWKSQAQETQNVATALKHMAAYCSGTNSADPSLTRDVTAEDLKKLDRQRLLQQKLPDKHASQINVLRAKQDRDMRNKLEKQKLQLEQLDKDMQHQLAQEAYHHAQERDHLDSVMKMRRKRVEKRWDLRYEMWRKDWEKRNGQALPGRIPQEEWPENADQSYLIHSTSAMAVYNSALTALLMEVGHEAFETRIRGHLSGR